MNSVEIKIKRVNKEAKIPIYATEEAAGFDFYALDNIDLKPGIVTKIPTGLAFEMPKGFCFQIVGRSGLSAKGIYNLIGIADSDYRGEIHLLVLNTTNQSFHIEKGDRIAQALLVSISSANFKEVDSLSETKRGTGGFHSTGKK